MLHVVIHMHYYRITLFCASLYKHDCTCQRFIKKWYVLNHKKVSVFAEKGVFFKQKSAKRVVVFTPGEH